MRIDGVLPLNAENRAWRRSEPDASTLPRRTPFRFSTIDVILDLSADAAAYTGHDAKHGTRRHQYPPETYTQFGTLAYNDSPDTGDGLQDAIVRTSAAKPSRVKVVTFDGQLNFREATESGAEIAG